MARKLKTYTTSAGFFDLAVAAPSMKAALEAWGSKNNLFQHGFARVTDDPKIVASTMAHPGVVLRRPVGTTGAFGEHARLPTNLPVGKPRQPVAKQTAKKHVPPPRPVDDKSAREAARAFEKEQKRQESERRKEQASREKERARRERAVGAAEAALEAARQDHQARLDEIAKERAALDRRSRTEDTRWNKKKEELEAAQGAVERSSAPRLRSIQRFNVAAIPAP